MFSLVEGDRMLADFSQLSWQDDPLSSAFTPSNPSNYQHYSVCKVLCWQTRQRRVSPTGPAAQIPVLASVIIRSTGTYTTNSSDSPAGLVWYQTELCSY